MASWGWLVWYRRAICLGNERSRGGKALRRAVVMDQILMSKSVTALTESSAVSPSQKKTREKCDSIDRVDSPIKPERDVGELRQK